MELILVTIFNRRCLLFLIFLLPVFLVAQDKLFFRDGTSRKGYLVSMSKDLVYFRASDTSVTEKINKSKLALIEDYKGKRYLFAEGETISDDGHDPLAPGIPTEPSKHRNILTAQPLGLVFGRATLNYERLSKDEKIGISLPFSLTFDPTNLLYNSKLDTTANNVNRIKGVNYITGLDIHFYIGTKKHSKFFVGPRFRYGTDLFLRNTSGYSLQTEFGWLSAYREKGYTQSLSFGFGFVRLITAPNGLLVDPKQSYSWLSVNYKVGVKW